MEIRRELHGILNKYQFVSKVSNCFLSANTSCVLVDWVGAKNCFI